MTKTNTPTATLIRGETYRLNTKDGYRLFEKDKPESVTEEERKRLSEAVDMVTIHDPEAPNGLRHRQAAKFVFT